MLKKEFNLAVKLYKSKLGKDSFDELEAQSKEIEDHRFLIFKKLGAKESTVDILLLHGKVSGVLVKSFEGVIVFSKKGIYNLDSAARKNLFIDYKDITAVVLGTKKFSFEIEHAGRKTVVFAENAKAISTMLECIIAVLNPETVVEEEVKVEKPTTKKTSSKAAKPTKAPQVNLLGKAKYIPGKIEQGKSRLSVDDKKDEKQDSAINVADNSLVSKEQIAETKSSQIEKIGGSKKTEDSKKVTKTGKQTKEDELLSLLDDKNKEFNVVSEMIDEFKVKLEIANKDLSSIEQAQKSYRHQLLKINPQKYFHLQTHLFKEVVMEEIDRFLFGDLILIDNEVKVVVDSNRMKPGLAPVCYHISFLDMNTLEKSRVIFNKQDKIPMTRVSKREAKYCNICGDFLFFMDTDTYESYEFPLATFGDLFKYVTEGTIVTVLVYKDIPIFPLPSSHIRTKAVSISAINEDMTKFVVVESGATIKVPAEVEVGDTFSINVYERTFGRYLGKDED